MRNPAKDGDGKVHVLKRYIGESKVPLLLIKGVYPYDYMDCMDRLNLNHPIFLGFTIPELSKVLYNI